MEGRIRMRMRKRRIRKRRRRRRKGITFSKVEMVSREWKTRKRRIRMRMRRKGITLSKGDMASQEGLKCNKAVTASREKTTTRESLVGSLWLKANPHGVL